MLHLPAQSLPCFWQHGCGQLAGPPGQQAAGDATAAVVCAWVLDVVLAEAFMGHDPQSPPLPIVQLPPPASIALPAPSISTTANDAAMEKRNFFKIYSLNNVLRFSEFVSEPRELVAIARN